MSKSLFNFYLDDKLKEAAIMKLARLNGTTSKGQLASFIRVQIQNFVETPDEDISPKLMLKVLRELQLCNNQGRISKL